MFSTGVDSGRLYDSMRVHKLVLEITGEVKTTDVRLLVAFSELYMCIALVVLLLQTHKPL